MSRDPRTVSTLYRVGDVAQLRGTDPPVLAIVLAVQPRRGRVRVAYYDPGGLVVRRWLAPPALIQATMQYAMRGIPVELQALRGLRSDQVP